MGGGTRPALAGPAQAEEAGAREGLHGDGIALVAAEQDDVGRGLRRSGSRRGRGCGSEPRLSTAMAPVRGSSSGCAPVEVGARHQRARAGDAGALQAGADEGRAPGDLVVASPRGGRRRRSSARRADCWRRRQPRPRRDPPRPARASGVGPWDWVSGEWRIVSRQWSVVSGGCPCGLRFHIFISPSDHSPLTISRSQRRGAGGAAAEDGAELVDAQGDRGLRGAEVGGLLGGGVGGGGGGGGERAHRRWLPSRMSIS